MLSRRLFRKPKKPLCSDLANDDGLDPRSLAKPSPAKVTNRKALQLCRQIERTLIGALSGCVDGLLRDLLVQAVVPAPDAARVLVTVALIDREEVGCAEVLAALARAQRWLRGEVASAIHRKKVPELTFQVMTAP